ncbi:hypothetical protein RJ639_004428, partial [Escallonia herrerae]
MDQIQHKFTDIRGVKLHIADIGTGPSVVFLHGFPEIWYSWRNEMIAVANAGFRAIALDLRGYGLSEKHPEPEKASFNDFVEDTFILLLFIFLLAHKLSLEKIVEPGLSICSAFSTLQGYLELCHWACRSSLTDRGYEDLPEGFYVSRWKQPGRAEADFSWFDVKTVLRNIYILFSRSEMPIAQKDQEIMDIGTTWRDRYNHPKLQVPVLLIMGGKDYFLKFPGIEDYITSGKVKECMPDMEMQLLPSGTHFIQEQLPEQMGKKKRVEVKYLRSSGDGHPRSPMTPMNITVGFISFTGE